MAELIARQTLPSGATLSLHHGDLTGEAVDAIVNAANEALQLGAGVAGAIASKGGPEVQRECDAWVRTHGRVPTGAAAITGAGRLPARWVIHAVGPVWSGDPADSDALLRGAVISALALAAEHGLSSLALPAISTGVFGFPKERAAGVIVQAILDFCAAHPASTLRDLRLTLIDAPTVEVFRAEFARRWG